MCINPRIHASGLSTPCHQCWQCKENRINDWVGRCIAERGTSLVARTVTLTYGGGDVPESRFLRKSDTTTYLKALRNDGHKVRFFFTGEYGTAKGRAHWHIVLFFQTPAPFREMRKNITCEYWPHGFSYWTECEPHQIRYVMKYINKDATDEMALKTMGMSRKPILGYRHLCELAGRYVAAGISPQRPFYKFADVLDKHGKPIEFYMPPLVAEQFIGAFIAQWHATREGFWPHSDLVDKYHDKASRFVRPVYLTPFRRGESPWMLPPPGYTQKFDEPKNTFYADRGGHRLYWSFDEEGQRAWRENLVTPAEAEKLQLQSRPSPDANAAAYATRN